MKRVALALSSGGMFGAYQAGVWKELETIVQPAVVTGASIGSLNGWAIAGGISGEELRDWWLRVGGAQQTRLQFPKSWLDGIMDSGPLGSQIERLFSAYPRMADFGVTVTELPRFRPRLIVNEEVTWQHLAASCAVIGVLRMHRLNKRIYADGGILEPMPLQGITHFGADLVIGVNILPIEANPTYRAMIRIMQTVTRYRPASLPGIPFIELGPPDFLGLTHDAIYYSRPNFDRWYEAGRLAMRSKLNLLQGYLR